MRLRAGISTCPNDTFAFHAWLAGEVGPAAGVDAIDWTLADVEALNRMAAAGELDLAKVSCAAALERSDEFVVLPSGAALGRGVGPLVLAANGRDRAATPRVLCPGEGTTAHLLWRLFHPEPARVEQVVFDEIMPALERGEADLGVCIHEARFTYAERGLERVEDLGETWERATGAPLPLGCVVARRSLGPEVLAGLARCLRESLERARADPEATLPTMRAHAQEQSDAVLWKHVELYVSDATLDLGAEGRRALAELAARAERAGLRRPGAALEVQGAPATERLFHLADPAAFEAARASGAPAWAPPSLANEGFVHGSLAAQLPDTLATHYANADALLLLEVDRTRTAALLRMEVSRGGERFPHWYGALPFDAFVREWRLDRSADGWSLPVR